MTDKFTFEQITSISTKSSQGNAINYQDCDVQLQPRPNLDNEKHITVNQINTQNEKEIQELADQNCQSCSTAVAQIDIQEKYSESSGDASIQEFNCKDSFTQHILSKDVVDEETIIIRLMDGNMVDKVDLRFGISKRINEEELSISDNLTEVESLKQEALGKKDEEIIRIDQYETDRNIQEQTDDVHSCNFEQNIQDTLNQSLVGTTTDEEIEGDVSSASVTTRQPPAYTSVANSREDFVRYDGLADNPHLNVIVRCGNMRPSPPFIYRVPPPTYAESELMRFNMTLGPFPASSPFWGPKPLAAVCPICGTFNITKIKYRSNRSTHLLACVLCVCFCWPCCIFPYFLPSCQSTEHYCTTCHALLGTYRPW